MAGHRPILHVINRLAPGGAEKQLSELVSRSRLDHEVHELATATAGRRGEMRSTLAHRIRQSSPAAIVAWLDRPQIATTVSTFRGPPLVASVRGRPERRRGHKAWTLRLALARYRCIVTNSQALQSATQDFLGPLVRKPVLVIPNGVEMPADPALPGPRHRGPLRVGFIGRDSWSKGLEVLLDSLELLDPGTVDATLIGEGVPAALERRPALVSCCRGFGRVDDPWARLGPIDVLAVPSRSEGSPNVVLEAFSRRVPVIGTADPSTRELLEPARGLVVPIDDSRALAEAVRRFSEDPAESARCAAEARRYVQSTHEWQRVVDAWDELLAGFAPSSTR